MNDQSLTLEQKTWLAKQLPEVIRWVESTWTVNTPPNGWFEWREGNEIRDTEWLSIVHMVEKKLTAHQREFYYHTLCLYLGHHGAISASASQRTNAMRKVLKGK